MPTEKEIVDELRRFYEGGGMRQKDLAGALDLNPQQLAEILATRNRPTAAQILRIQEFLKDKTMSSIRIDPPKFPKPSTRDPSVPLTLASAKEMLAARDAEIAALRRGAAASPAKPALTVPKLAGSGADASPTYPATGTPGANQPNKNQMAVNVPAVKKAALSKSAVSPVLCQRELDIADFDTVLSMLDNPVHTRMQQACIYAEVKKRRNLEANRLQ